jgi:hypothetical protein
MNELRQSGIRVRLVLLETQGIAGVDLPPDGRRPLEDLFPADGPRGQYDYSTLLWDPFQREYCWESIHNRRGSMWRAASPQSGLPHKTYIVVEITPERAAAAQGLPKMPWVE